MSNFSYKDAKGRLTRVPVRYGDTSRMVASIIKENSENTMPSAPLIACYIKDLQYDIDRRQDPSFVSSLHIRERDFDATNQEYLNTQGANYTVERLMPVPYKITFMADIWTTNTDQKLQLWEQIAVLFNPILEIQTTDNYIDWTSLSFLELTGQTFSSRSIPQGLEQDIDIVSLTFTAPIWITPPAKIKKMGIITKIIANVFDMSTGTIDEELRNPGAVEMFGDTDTRVVVTPGNYELLVLNNVATLVRPSGLGDNIDTSNPENTASWRRILDLYPGKFVAGLSQIRLTKADGNEIVAYVSLDPIDESKMMLNIDSDTAPGNTVILGRGTVDAIIDPETFNPGSKAAGTRYLILEDINVNNQYAASGYDGPDAWKNSNGSDFQAHANDIIEWTGTQWNVVFNSQQSTGVTYITNSYTGVQYKWESGTWTKSFEGIYEQNAWRLVL